MGHLYQDIKHLLKPLGLASGYIYLFSFILRKLEHVSPVRWLHRCSASPGSGWVPVLLCWSQGWKEPRVALGGFFPPAQRYLFPLGWDWRAGDYSGLWASSLHPSSGFPKLLLRGLRALLKTSLFCDVCYCNLCMMLPLVEKQGLYLRGNYTCINTAHQWLRAPGTP